MDFVSVNLSRADASLVLRAVEGALDKCPCAERSSSRCHRCDALGAIRSDLVRLLTAPQPLSRSVLPVLRSGALELDLRAASWPWDPSMAC